MAEVIKMPLLSDTMKEGKIAAWLKKVGDAVKSDDVLAEVETDKATMEVMGYADGILLYIGVEAGQSAAIDQVICIIGMQGEDISALINNTNTAAPQANAAPAASPAPANTAIPKELTIIQMPLLSDTMKEGKIASWLKQVGDTVKSDDVLAEVETDKATMEVIGYADGTLLYKGADAGNSVLVNGTMAVVGPAGFDIAPFIASLQAQASPSVAAPVTTIATPAVSNTAPVATTNTTTSNGRLFASPLAKKIAADKGINLSNIVGSGDGGRIIAKDVLQAPTSNATSTAPINQAPVFTPNGTEGHTDVPVSQMRAVIAERLSSSKHTAPHFYLKISVQLDNLLALRKQINEAQPVKVSINDMIIKACATALRKHPEVNSSWLGNTIRTHHHIHIGSAVAIPDGLIVPVIKFADEKKLTQIAQDANMLYDKAKSKKLQPHEFTGNTFTISNLGMMGIEDFTAIINPPDAAILAIGAGVPTPVADSKGNVSVKTVMKLTLSCDHRVIDGAVGATFLQTLKGLLESPIGMFI
jgi:pyruvate dehydrogenase E2 component (dihydrolipoamide acetyltransferase)